jgi:hypothetical protein
VLAVTDAKGFVAFDKELRDALTRQDAGMMALLVRYPLRINDDRGSWYIDDAPTLQRRFQDIFPPAVRAAVLDRRVDKVNCSYRGIMYGDGTVWVNPTVQSDPKPVTERYLVETINPRSQGTIPDPANKIEFVCETSTHRVIVDLGAGGAPRYRDWDKPRSLLEKPDLEIGAGHKSVEGTGSCTYSIWTFNSGGAKIEIQTLGCFADSSQPPKGARGKLTVSVKDKADASSWCF